RPLALHAVHGFDVVLVVERRGGPGVDHGVVEREADALLAQHHAAAAPGLGLHIAVGVVEVIAVDYVHSWSFRWSSGGGSAMQRAGAIDAAPARAGRVSGQDGLGCGSELEHSGLD